MHCFAHRSICVPALLIPAALLSLVSGCALINPPDDLPELRAQLLDLCVTEINYNPVAEATIDGDDFEFIELKNKGSTTIALDDVAFTDGIEYLFAAGSTIEPGEFLVIAANSAQFTARYSFAPDGIYSGKLNNAGEKIALSDQRAQKEIFAFEYKDQSPWPAAADGGGRTLVPFTAAASSDLSNAGQWRASFRINGSPGADDPDIVLVNEALTHTDLPALDAIELYNPNSSPVDIGGWFLTDRKVDPVKFRIPTGTVIAANGYLTFTSEDFNAAPGTAACFALSEHGEEVFLSADSTGYRSGYCHGFSFGEMENGVSFGRYVNSVGAECFIAQKSTSLGTENAGPRVGPIVLSEIMYNPENGRDEFIEVKNTGTATVALYDENFPDNTWKIGGTNFAFPKNSSIKGGETIVIASDAISTGEFRTLYKVAASVQLFTASLDLSDAEDTLSLLEPSEPYLDSTVSLTIPVVPYLLIEEVCYKDGGAWPNAADGSGSSLHRITASAFGNDPANWKSGTASPGNE